MENKKELLTIEYLNKYGLNALQKNYRIKIKIHSKYKELYQFRYSQIKSPMSSPIVQECRGLILQKHNDKKWSLVAFPFQKFFNFNEPNAHKVDFSNAIIYEKVDGSLCTLYWYKDEWHVASSSLPDGSGNLRKGDGKLIFAELFWDIWKKLKYKLPSDTTKCYMFEMITPRHPIMVRPEKEEIYLLGVRSLVDYKEYHPQEIAQKCGWKCVPSYSFSSFEEVLKATRKLNPVKNEGFVVCDMNFNRVKVKSPQYVALSHLKNNDRGKKNVRGMLEIVRTNEGDEFLGYFPQYKNLHKSVKLKYDEFINRMKEIIQKMKSNSDTNVELLCADADEENLVNSVMKNEYESVEEYCANCEIVFLKKMVFKEYEKYTIPKVVSTDFDDGETDRRGRTKKKKNKKKK